MLHKTAPFRFAPDELTKTEMDSLGLGDPSAALKRDALRDLFCVAVVFVISFLIASYFDIGDWYREASVAYEDWEFDEIAVAVVLSAGAFGWFSWRQWHRYKGEVQRRFKLEEEMVEMRIVADHLGDNKSLFLANLAHDFRTPLNGILGFAEMMRELPYSSLDEARYKSYVRTIQDSARMLDDRITTCLDPDKIEFGAEPMQMISYPLKNAVTGAMPIVQGIAESAGITIVDKVSNNLPQIHADGRALRKIIITLVTNAIKHSRPQGKVEIAAAVTEDEDLCLTIADNGIGMDTRLLTAVSEGKQPERSGDDLSIAMTGIGLLVVKKLLDLHQATLEIDTSPKTGTTATILFPSHRLIPAARR